MAERKFKLTDPSLVSCDLPCDQEFAREVEGSKIKETGNLTTTVRCVASGAAMRGQHYEEPSIETHIAKLNACRVCTIYTHVDNTQAQG